MSVSEGDRQTDLLVLGGGPGGYSAAFAAAAKGITTTIVEADPVLGGVCLNRGCIPSKTLLAMTELLAAARNGESMGLEFSPPKINLQKVNEYKAKVVEKLNRALAATAKKLGVQIVNERVEFDSSTRVVSVADRGGSIEFERAVIAAGSRPLQLPAFQLNSPRILDSSSALQLERIPQNALVIGGGYIGLELGSVMCGFGAEVTVVEMLDRLVTGCDHDLAKPLLKRLGKEFAQVCLETRVTAMREVDQGIEVTFEGRQTPKRTVFDQVLVAVGRRPNSDALNLQAAGVKLDDRGFIKVDGYMRTSVPHIYAIGDIVGNPMLAHKAAAEARIVARVLAGEDITFSPRCIPSVVFTDPELAWVGLTEEQATASGVPVEIRKMQWVACGRAAAVGRTEGITKMIFEPGSGRVLGAGIVGIHAGEMISEAALAIETGATAEDLARTIHPHPTIAEVMSEVAEMI